MTPEEREAYLKGKTTKELTPSERTEIFQMVKKKIPADYGPFRRKLAETLLDREVIDFHITDNEGNWKFVYNMSEEQAKEVLKSFDNIEMGHYTELFNGKPRWVNVMAMWFRVSWRWSRKQCLEKCGAIFATAVPSSSSTMAPKKNVSLTQGRLKRLLSKSKDLSAT